MSRTRRSQAFHCTNDCQMTGCPGHMLEVIWEHTSDTIAINIDGNCRWVCDDAKLSTIMDIVTAQRQEWQQRHASERS